MEPILLLTKNCLAEKRLVEKLHNLGYEVLSSSFLLEQILQGKIVFSSYLFEKILISITVPDEEVEQIVKTLSRKRFVFYRQDTQNGENKEIKAPLIEGVMYLGEEPSLRELRESFSFQKFNKEREEERNFGQENYLIINKDKFETFIRSLSRNELKLFKTLYAEHGKPTTRNEIVTAMWHKEANASQLAQLSQLSKKLHYKLENAGLPSSILVTKWKKGYQLSDEFFQSLSEEMKEVIDRL